jgi:hypothetical protein
MKTGPPNRQAISKSAAENLFTFGLLATCDIVNLNYVLPKNVAVLLLRTYINAISSSAKITEMSLQDLNSAMLVFWVIFFCLAFDSFYIRLKPSLHGAEAWAQFRPAKSKCLLIGTSKPLG